jgi:hypothetical protein
MFGPNTTGAAAAKAGTDSLAALQVGLAPVIHPVLAQPLPQLVGQTVGAVLAKAFDPALAKVVRQPLGELLPSL